MIEPGARLEDQYRIEKLVGAGGMGLVYQARDEASGARVAVKVMRSRVIESQSDLARFQREAVVLRKLDHPNIVRVLRVGVLSGGAPYMVMELLVGRDLRAELRERGALPLSEVAGYMLQVCDAVSTAHREQVVHRDLKPQNMFLTNLDGDRQVKLLDFGVSKLTLDGEATATGTHEMLGTPHFMSPEQVRSSKHVDHRTDIWSLGVVLYVLTTGRFPFARPSPTAVIAAIPFDDPTPPRALVPELPLAFESLVLRCLQKMPDDRFQSASDLMTELRPFAAERVRVEGVAPIRSLPPIAMPNSERALEPATVRNLRRVAARTSRLEYSAAPVSTRRQFAAPAQIALASTGDETEPLHSLETLKEPEPLESVATLPSTPPQREPHPLPSPASKGRVPLMAAGAVLLLVLTLTGFVLLRAPSADSARPMVQVPAVARQRAPVPAALPSPSSAAAEPANVEVPAQNASVIAPSPEVVAPSAAPAPARVRPATERVKPLRRAPVSPQPGAPATVVTPTENPSHL